MTFTPDYTKVPVNSRTAAGNRTAASVRESFQDVQQKMKALEQAVSSLKNQIDRSWPN